MEFITSRGFKLPATRKGMEQHDWFNVWKRREFPYQELLEGDILYWFDRPNQRLAWKTKVEKVIRRCFKTKKEILEDYPTCADSEYFQKASNSGYFLMYKVKVIEALNIDKPKNFRFPQLGWVRINRDSLWVGLPFAEDEVPADIGLGDFHGSLAEFLRELNVMMKGVSPERVKKAVNIMIRKDGRMIRALKRAKGYACEFPDCGHRIRKQDGTFYVEVAHVDPVAKGGKSILGNLLVLCPNHHKEFDHGKLRIIEQSEVTLRGSINERAFCFRFNYT